MNEFIEQFLIEARELIEQATDDLLALERQPEDKERLDSAFRAFHTLKGSAGIIDFAAMGRALHAAEDVLARIRSAAKPITPDLVSDCLACLDQVAQWLEAMQETGEPPTDAEPSAEVIVRRFAQETAAAPGAGLEEIAAHPSVWLDDFLARHPKLLAEARTAVRYAPDAQCFFRGEDPLTIIEALPGLLALELTPSRAWTTLDAFDPFSCYLVLTALTSAPAAQVAAALEPIKDQIDIQSLQSSQSVDTTATLSPAARDLIAAQIALLADGIGVGFAGRLGSAGRVAANVLRHAGLAAETVLIDQRLATSQTTGDARAMIAALKDVLTGETPGSPPKAEFVATPQETAATVLRVDVARIDALVRLTGELTVVKNAIGYTSGMVQAGGDPKAAAARLKEQHALLHRLIGELQRSVLAVRVLPLRQVFQRFPRLVREMGLSLGKQARLTIEGDDTDADKAIVESLFEPLLHVLRNSLDHGIEGREERLALGKPATATVGLRAAREGEHLIVEVSDDGSGIDVARVRQVAAERGLASTDVLTAMSDDAAVQLIFAPGFSTAKVVTSLSGRGVGMDSVRSAIGRMGGRVHVESRQGQGTTVRFTLPFTVVMSQVMTVEVAEQIFGIPLNAVIETIRLPRQRITNVGAARAFVLRNRTIPLCSLADTLHIIQAEPTSAEVTIVVASIAGQLTGLEVDRIGERMDVMLKPMDGLLSGSVGIAGTTLLGDGRVLVVLDLQELLL